jgi:hypothetical protein
VEVEALKRWRTEALKRRSVEALKHWSVEAVKHLVYSIESRYRLNDGIDWAFSAVPSTTA